MPGAALQICAYPGCGRLNCERHKRKPWQSRPDITKRITGRKLQALREQLFQEHPLCEECLRKTPPRYSASAQRDHIIPLAEGGTEDPSNIQALCNECHEKKSQAESLRGRGFPA